MDIHVWEEDDYVAPVWVHHLQFMVSLTTWPVQPQRNDPAVWQHAGRIVVPIIRCDSLRTVISVADLPYLLPIQITLKDKIPLWIVIRVEEGRQISHTAGQIIRQEQLKSRSIYTHLTDRSPFLPEESFTAIE
jgi:hypothetical protein